EEPRCLAAHLFSALLDWTRTSPCVLTCKRGRRLLSGQCVEHTSLSEWSNTRLEFQLTEHGKDATLLSFRHVGLVPALVCYADCESGWDHFLPSLAAYVEMGAG